MPADLQAAWQAVASALEEPPARPPDLFCQSDLPFQATFGHFSKREREGPWQAGRGSRSDPSAPGPGQRQSGSQRHTELK